MIINDSLKLATIPLSLAASGPVGTAATTVDIGAKLRITATVASLVLTLPSPTDATSGDLLLVETVTNSATVNGTLIPVGTVTYFSWNGTAWASDANVGRNMGAVVLVAAITVGNNTVAHNLALPAGSFSSVVYNAFTSTGNQVMFRRVSASDTANGLVVNSSIALTNVTFYITALA